MWREQGAQVLRELSVGAAADPQGRDAKGGQAGDEGRADRAGAKDGHRPAGQRIADRLADDPVLDAAPQLREVPQQEQQVHDRGLGDGDRVAGTARGDVGDRDSQSPGGIQVHALHTDAELLHQGGLGQVKQRRVHRPAQRHQDVDLARAELRPVVRNDHEFGAGDGRRDRVAHLREILAAHPDQHDPTVSGAANAGLLGLGPARFEQWARLGQRPRFDDRADRFKPFARLRRLHG
ncbi:MAG TPA: hypothetical protein VMG38_10920 [Trebonia sp.]|nr:hypothetical protein [Trebonia sp.]